MPGYKPALGDINESRIPEVCQDNRGERVVGDRLVCIEIDSFRIGRVFLNDLPLVSVKASRNQLFQNVPTLW